MHTRFVFVRMLGFGSWSWLLWVGQRRSNSGAQPSYMLPSKFALSSCLLESCAAIGGGSAHLVVTFLRAVKNSIAPSPVMSWSPNLERVPYRPPNVNCAEKPRHKHA